MLGVLMHTLLVRGVMNLVVRRREAVKYWKGIAKAALRPADNGRAQCLRLPSGSFRELFPVAADLPVSISDYSVTYGDMPISELLLLCRLVRYKQPERIFEFGTFRGQTTLQLALNTNAKVFTLDLPPKSHPEFDEPMVWDPTLDVYPDNPGCCFASSECSHRIEQIFANSTQYDFEPFKHSIDFVLVDACHHYEYVKRDSENAVRMLASGGMIVWHDYALAFESGVVRALEELAERLPLLHIAGTSLVVYHDSSSIRETCAEESLVK